MSTCPPDAHVIDAATSDNRPPRQERARTGSTRAPFANNVIPPQRISPVATKDFAARIAALGCDYVDAPVSGGEVGAKAALMGGFASSRILEVHAERMINRTFNPGFRIRLHQKDLNLALSSARELGLALPNTAVAQQMMTSVSAHGGADLDHSALVQAIEDLGNFAIPDRK